MLPSVWEAGAGVGLDHVGRGAGHGRPKRQPRGGEASGRGKVASLEVIQYMAKA